MPQIDEEVTEAPEISNLEQAFAEGDRLQAVDDLAEGEGELTIEDIRKLPGAEKLDDAALQQLLKESKGEEETPAATQAAIARAWKYFGADGKEVSDIAKMTVADFLKGKFGYNAMGKQQQKSFEELLRVAQNGHLNESKLGRTQAERDQFHKRFTEREQQFNEVSQRQKLVEYAFTQFAIGNDEPLKKLLDGYGKSLGKPDFGQQAPAAVDPTAQQEGLRIWYEEVVPKVDAVAEKYGAKAAEVRNAAQQLIDQELSMTNERLAEIIEYELPMLLENAGYGVKAAAQTLTAPPANAAAAPNELADMKKQLAAMQIELKNARTDRIKGKQKNLPPASGAAGASGDEGSNGVPKQAMKDRSSYKKFLDS